MVAVQLQTDVRLFWSHRIPAVGQVGADDKLQRRQRQEKRHQQSCTLSKQTHTSMQRFHSGNYDSSPQRHTQLYMYIHV